MPTVAILGNSLVLSSIRASLERQAGLRLHRFDMGLRGSIGQLSAVHPDAVVFDLASQPSDSAFALWKSQPQTLLIGVDMTVDQVLVFSSQITHVLTPEHLVEVIEAHAPAETNE